ncbi:MAG: hypothetical protein D6675_01500 [Gemmatimonadetes bacterium]|nr:MAG: hypothetical protein D6675_01500 [Gemmatimonadota bacterium]
MKKWTIFSLMLLFSVATANAASNTGTVAAQFLKIGVGAQAAAMGGATTAHVNDPAALYWNVGALAHLNQPALYGAHTEWFAGIQHDFIGLTLPIGANNILGLSLIALTTGDIEQTTLSQQDGTGIFYDVADIALGISAARQLTDRFSVGVTGKYVRQTVWNESAATFAFDIGALMITDLHGMRLGMQFSNLSGDLKLNGSDLLAGDGTQQVTESYALPVRFQFGIALDVVGHNMPEAPHRLTVAIDGTHPGDGAETLHLGLEYAHKTWLFLRSGYVINHDTADVSFGGGVRWSLAQTPFQLDYAYADLGLLDDVQRVSLKLNF